MKFTGRTEQRGKNRTEPEREQALGRFPRAQTASCGWGLKAVRVESGRIRIRKLRAGGVRKSQAGKRISRAEGRQTYWVKSRQVRNRQG